MRSFAIAVALFSLVAGFPTVAHAAVGCTLDNPQDDLARFYPEFSDFTVHTLSFAVQSPAGYRELTHRLGGTLDPVYETSDVPYAIYTVHRDGQRLGYAFGTNQRGTFSNIQIVAAIDTEGTLRHIYVQKIRSPDHAAFTGEAFRTKLAAIPLRDYPSFSDCYTHGRCDTVPIADPTDGRQADDYRAILRALAKLHHVAVLLLQPGSPPTYPDDRARAEYLDSLWIPEQGFGPLDTPPRVSVRHAEEHLLDADALVAALPGHDRTTLYPISLLTAHPVIQDTLDGRIVTIAWSSPSHTLTVLESQGDPPLRFSHTMNLLFGHQTMLERTTRTEWSPVLADLVQGPAPTASLRHVPGGIVLPWRTARALFPDAEVATPTDPYSKHKAFYAAHRARFDAPRTRERVIVLSQGAQRRIIRKETVASEPFLQTRLGRTPVLVVNDAGGRAAYRTDLDGRSLQFDLHSRDIETGAGLLRDTDTGSTWEALTGRAIAGPLAGASLTPVVFHEMPEESAAALFP